MFSNKLAVDSSKEPEAMLNLSLPIYYSLHVYDNPLDLYTNFMRTNKAGSPIYYLMQGYTFGFFHSYLKQDIYISIGAMYLLGFFVFFISLVVMCFLILSLTRSQEIVAIVIFIYASMLLTLSMTLFPWKETLEFLHVLIFLCIVRQCEQKKYSKVYAVSILATMIISGMVLVKITMPIFEVGLACYALCVFLPSLGEFKKNEFVPLLVGISVFSLSFLWLIQNGQITWDYSRWACFIGGTKTIEIDFVQRLYIYVSLMVHSIGGNALFLIGTILLSIITQCQRFSCNHFWIKGAFLQLVFIVCMFAFFTKGNMAVRYLYASFAYIFIIIAFGCVSLPLVWRKVLLFLLFFCWCGYISSVVHGKVDWSRVYGVSFSPYSYIATPQSKNNYNNFCNWIKRVEDD